jgi:hypothetical protein
VRPSLDSLGSAQHASQISFNDARLHRTTTVASALELILGYLEPEHVATIDEGDEFPKGKPNDLVIERSKRGCIGYVYTSKGSWVERFNFTWPYSELIKAVHNELSSDVLWTTGRGKEQFVRGGIIDGELHLQGPDRIIAHSGIFPLAGLSLGGMEERWDHVYTDHAHVGEILITGRKLKCSEPIEIRGLIVDQLSAKAVVADSLFIVNVYSKQKELFFNDLSFTQVDKIDAQTLVLGSSLTITPKGLECVSGELSFGKSNLRTMGTVDSPRGNFGQVYTSYISLADGVIHAQKDVLLLDFTKIETKASLSIASLLTGEILTSHIHTKGLSLGTTCLESGKISDQGSLEIKATGIKVCSDIYSTLPMDLGRSTQGWRDLWIHGRIRSATDGVEVSTLLSLNQIDNAQDGMSLFFDGSTKKWVPGVFSFSVQHSKFGGLFLDDHKQYTLNAGRAGGQLIVGGTEELDDLVLSPTAHRRKGIIKVFGSLVPGTFPLYDPEFNEWRGGQDLGSNAYFYQNLHIRGEIFGLRLENVFSSELPKSKRENAGRLFFTKDTHKVALDTGEEVRQISVTKVVLSVNFDNETTKEVLVPSVTDVSLALVQFLNPSDNYREIPARIDRTEKNKLTITVQKPLIGNYRLIILE